MKTIHSLTPPRRGFLVSVVVALLGLRLWFHLTASPLPDEAYYWLWGRNLEWSYFDHPPLQAWMQAVTHAVFGTSLFALRLPAMVTSGIVLACLIWWGKRFGADRDDLLIGVAAILASPLMFLMMGIVFNDHLLIALLSLALIQIFLVFAGQMRGNLRLRHLYLAAVLMGLAGLTKYNAALFALGAVAMIAATRDLRPLLRNPHLYLAGLLSLACLAPVALWNVDHNGASMQYNLHDRLIHAQGLSDYLGRIAAFGLSFGLSLSPILLGAILSLYRRSNLPPDMDILRRIALWIFTLSTLAWLSVSYWTLVLYYWNVIAVVAILPLMSIMLRPKWLSVHLVLGLLLNAALVFNHSIFPFAAYGGRVDDETALMYGWPQVSAAIQAYDSDFLVTTDYRSASILAFWLDRPDVTVIARRISQFTLWLDPAQHAGQEAIILSSDAFPITSDTLRRFNRIDDLGKITIMHGGHVVTHYDLHRGIGFHGE